MHLKGEMTSVLKKQVTLLEEAKAKEADGVKKGAG